MRKNTKVNEERWKEMDWDKNGSISFAEFCFAFTGWVSVEYAEED